MYDIKGSKKMENGIEVFYQHKGGEKLDSFNYNDII